MFRCEICFVLIVTLGFSAQLIDGAKIPAQSLRTVVSNTDVTLICRHPSSGQYDRNVTWYFSSMDQPSIKLISDDDRIKRTMNSNSLLIRNVTIEDAGMYICCVDGPCTDTFLVVLEFENILSFAPGLDDASGEIVVSRKGDFSITAHLGSDLNIDIVKEPSVSICNYFTGNSECFKTRKTNNTSYHMKNAKLQNSGQFEIQSSVKDVYESYRLNILIQGKPVLSVERVVTEDGINFNCHGHAYPPPVFEFRFIPDEIENTDSVSSLLLHSSAISNHSSNISATVVIALPTTGPGTVECTASNSEGIGHAATSVSGENFNDQNRIIGTQVHSAQLNPLQFAISSPIGVINASSTVHLECKAYFYTFSNSFIFEYNGTRNHVYGTLQGDAYVASFPIKVFTEEQVTCIAHFKNGTEISNK